MKEYKKGPIEKVKITQRKRVIDERGGIYHIMRKSDDHFTNINEVYSSFVYPNVIKGWHKHQIPTLNYTVIFGEVKLVMYDDREDSPTKGNLMELFIGERNYCSVQIPPNVWNGFKAIGNRDAYLINCCTHEHKDFIKSSTYIDPISNDLISYNWDIKHA
jgi:dTDP-4-dehydrorhamnose 3,5-epimerase